ncbi:MAG: hypothetical protein KAY32_11525 [Candidatus Eisenbacteria sp.]|nr:hypothetical protein [Candidatus Eisenbacteria bacterium]
MPAPGADRIVRTTLIAAYAVLTLAGLFLFRGIPVLNVALGFLVGAAVARRAGAALPALHAALWWAFTTAAITMAASWIELAGLLLVTHYWGPYSTAAGWVPLLPPPDSPNVSRIILFSVIVAPALQVLTTGFGGLVAVVIGHSVVKRDASHHNLAREETPRTGTPH